MFEKLIRVAACQLLSGEKVEENVSKVLNFIELCAEDNVDIVAFPEGCLFGGAADNASFDPSAKKICI